MLTLTTRASLRRWRHGEVVSAPGVFCLTALGVLMIGANDGGYAPPAWGWACLAFGWLAVGCLLVRSDVELSKPGAVLLVCGAGFVAWTAVSIAWSADKPQSVMELQRVLVYFLGAVAIGSALRARTAPVLLGGLLTGIVLVCALGLSTRLFPDAGAALDQFGQNRLAAPLGYWNALGIFAAMGALLALGCAARAAGHAPRMLAAGALPVLATTLYFTYSRGAWVAFAAGLLVVLALDRRRLQLLGTLSFVVIAPLCAVLIASRLTGLTSIGVSQGLASRDGRTLALILLGLSVAGAAMSLAARWLQDRVSGRMVVRRACAGLVGVAAVALVALAVVNSSEVADGFDEAQRSFEGEIPQRPQSERSRNDLNERLFTLRSNGRLEAWRVSLDQHDRHPWVGAGAGTFEQAWFRDRPIPTYLRDAHGAYVEALGELGWAGLVLLILAFVVPLGAALRSRTDLLPAALGPYAAFLVHAGVDWDWEMPAVTLVAVACAVLLMSGAGRVRRRLSPAMRAAAIVTVAAVTAFAAVGLVGNRALERASRDVEAGRWKAGLEHARTATRWAPWSAEALQHLGNAQLGLGRRRLAQRTLTRAASKAPGDWQIWFDLGTARRGSRRTRAYGRAVRLNPLATDIETLRERRGRERRPKRARS